MFRYYLYVTYTANSMAWRCKPTIQIPNMYVTYTAKFLATDIKLPKWLLKSSVKFPPPHHPSSYKNISTPLSGELLWVVTPSGATGVNITSAAGTYQWSTDTVSPYSCIISIAAPEEYGIYNTYQSTLCYDRSTKWQRSQLHEI